MYMKQPVGLGHLPTRYRAALSQSSKHGSLHRRVQRTGAVQVHAYAELTSKGKRVSPDSLVLGMQMGSGSYGEVFRGSHITDKGVLPVVLKRVKTKVEVGGRCRKSRGTRCQHYE
eukprot:226817-Pelagomonas_calceolata.AAC.1